MEVTKIWAVTTCLALIGNHKLGYIRVVALDFFKAFLGFNLGLLYGIDRF